MVDAVVCEWLRQVLGKDPAEHGYREVVKLFIVVFYADNGFIARQDLQQLQKSVNILVAIFLHVELFTNTKKTEVMICTSGKNCIRLP